MNGTDWPSPAANLSIVEQQIKKILAATGVDVPSLAIGLSSLLSLDESFFLSSIYPFLGDCCCIFRFLPIDQLICHVLHIRSYFLEITRG